MRCPVALPVYTVYSVGMKILIVDDHRLFLEGMQTILADLYPQHTVSAFSNCRSAIDSIDAGQSYDLILIDLHLPGLNGLDFLQSLKQRNIKSSVIVISSSTEENKIQSSLDLGARGFIPKYFSGEKFKVAIGKVLNGELYLPSEFAHLSVKRGRKMVIDKPKMDTTIILYGRKLEILGLISQGHSNKAIAQILNISESTVKTHVTSLFRTFEVNNRTACVMKGQELGLITQA